MNDNTRKYEMFSDASYYDMWCVRLTSDRSFNSVTSWHFEHLEDAEQLLKLLEMAK